METKNENKKGILFFKVIDIVIYVWTTIFFLIVCSVIYMGILYNVFWGYIAAFATCPLLHIVIKKIICDKFDKAVLSVVLRVLFILFCFFACKMYGRVYAFNEKDAQVYITEMLEEKYKDNPSYKFIDGRLVTNQYNKDDEYIEMKALVNYELQENGKKGKHSEEIMAKFNRETGEYSLSK